MNIVLFIYLGSPSIMITSKNVAVRSYEELQDYKVLYEEGKTKTTSKVKEGSGLEGDDTRIDENEKYDTHLDYDEYITIDPLSTGNNIIRTVKTCFNNFVEIVLTIYHITYTNFVYRFKRIIQKCSVV